MTLAVVIAVLMAPLACYFAAAHAVLKTCSRRRLSDLLAERGREAELPRITEHLHGLVLMTGVLRSAANVAGTLAVVGAVLHARGGRADGPSLAIAFAVTLAVQGVFNVAIPVSWARYREERLLLWSGPLLNALRVALLPVTRPLAVLDPLVRRISGVDLRDDEDDLSDQIIAAVEDHEDGSAVADDQKQMIEAVFDLRETDAGAVMTPRTDVQGVELSATLDDVRTTLLAEGHSRVPVYRENLDDIAGILYAKDLLPLLDDDARAETAAAFELKAWLREPMRVPESKNLLELLREFRSTQVHLAIVVDEYGGTAGLVTIEDILEEIVGEIHDEYEAEPEAPGVTTLGENRYRVDARMPVADLNDALDLGLPEDEEYDTLAGYVLESLGHIPEAGERFEADGLAVTVDEAEKTRVVAVTLERTATRVEA